MNVSIFASSDQGDARIVSILAGHLRQAGFTATVFPDEHGDSEEEQLARFLQGDAAIFCISASSLAHPLAGPVVSKFMRKVPEARLIPAYLDRVPGSDMKGKAGFLLYGRIGLSLQEADEAQLAQAAALIVRALTGQREAPPPARL